MSRRILITGLSTYWGGRLAQDLEADDLPVVPMILGFDPRFQFVHEDDIAGALAHAVRHDLPGFYNVAADGVLALSEVIGLLGRQPAPILPPWGTGLALPVLKRLGVRIPPDRQGHYRYEREVEDFLR